MRRTTLGSVDMDRLLDGEVAPEDAPPEYSELAALLLAASAGTFDWELAREAQTVAAMVQTVRNQSAGVSDPKEKGAKPVKSFLRLKIAAVAVGAVLAGTTALALAGALPDAAQDAAAKVFEKAGITIPNGHADDSGKPEDADGGREDAGVRQIIEDTEPGIERGREVSDEASDGNSRVPETVPNNSAHPNDHPTGGASETGISKSEEASDGRGRAGSHHPEGEGEQP